MVRHVIEQHFQITAVRVGKQRVKVVHRAEQWIDLGIVADVITEVGHGR
jgi:hypothetical protein